MKRANLVMVSGGVDSAYMLYHVLTMMNAPVHAHHISMRVMGEDRWRAEDAAIRKIITKLDHMGFNHTFSESVLDISQLPYMGWDTDTQLLVGARVAANLDADWVTLMLGITADDLARPVIQDRVRRRVLGNLWDALLQSIDEPKRGQINPEIVLPLRSMSKAQIVHTIPKDLLKLTWSCRRPVYTEDGPKPCGECHPCKQLAEIS